jgi:hypothetical protein
VALGAARGQGVDMMHGAGGLFWLHSGLLVLVLGLSARALVGTSPVQAQSGDRQPGEVRTLTDQTDSTRCYQLGQADQAQDQATGVRIDLASAMARAETEGGDLIATYTEDGRLEAAVITAGATTGACFDAYLGGYLGTPPGFL